MQRRRAAAQQPCYGTDFFTTFVKTSSIMGELLKFTFILCRPTLPLSSALVYYVHVHMSSHGVQTVLSLSRVTLCRLTLNQQ